MALWMQNPRRVHSVFARHHDVAVEIDFDQVRRTDFVEHEAVRVDQKMVLRPRHARRQMGEDHVGPAVVINQPISGGKVHTHLPLFAADLRAHVTIYRV